MFGSSNLLGIEEIRKIHSNTAVWMRLSNCIRSTCRVTGIWLKPLQLL